MSQPERDTHFAGFAEIVRKRMHFSDFALYHAGKSKIEVEHAQCAILAQALYDFAVYVTNHVAATEMDAEMVLRFVPDFIECTDRCRREDDHE